MSANTTGKTTIGAWAMTKTATAKTPTAASTRQLHWARRSIHPATSRSGRRSGIGLERLDQSATDGDGERRDRNRREDADDAGDRRAGRNGDDDDRRVQVHRSAVHDRTQEIVDDPVGNEHQDQQDQRGLRSDGAERDEEHGRHGQERADVWDEAAEQTTKIASGSTCGTPSTNRKTRRPRPWLPTGLRFPGR